MLLAMKDAHGNRLDPIWMAEFRGFFFGEGHLGITTNGTLKGKTYVARAAITLRDDDEPVLREIQARLGGLLHRERHGKISKINGKTHQTKPYVVWRVTSRADVARVCDILDAGVLPAKKRREVSIIREFLSTLGNTKPGIKSVEEQAVYDRLMARRASLAADLRAAHAYGGGSCPTV